MHDPASPSAPEPIAPPRPLLPPVILGRSAFLWLWALPVALLLALNVQGYLLIEGNMNADERGNAFLLGAAGLVNLLAGVAFYGAFRFGKAPRPESAWWGLPALVVQVGYLWMTMALGEDLLPRTVTDWIYPPERFLYNQFSFAMVPLFWGMTRLACARPAKGRGSALIGSLALAVAAPVLLYAFFQAIKHSDGLMRIAPVVVTIMVILFGVSLFVGVIRAMALWLRDADAWTPVRESVAIVVFALAMPLGGLLLNSEIPFPNDFQAWETYALTAANAVVLLAAAWLHARRPLLSLGLLCATLPFSLYFFTVFLPFLPLAPLAVIAMGAGFLILSPTVLLILHLSLLNKARRGASGPRLATGILCFLLLPGFFTARGLADKAALNAALDYVYSPALKGGPITYESSLMNLRRALANHRAYKDGIYYPLLSDYYAWLVFDDLVLPDDKLARLEETFFGNDGRSLKKGSSRSFRGNIWGTSRGSSNRDRNRMPRANPPPRTVEVAGMEVSTKPAVGEGASVATLKLTLSNTGGANAEYIKKLPLPAGVYVSGFRLHINGVAVPGRVTEKKTALWVYTMIRDSERRDPGLLFYNAPDELELRVFPVVSGTPSVVEIDFLVPGDGAHAGVWGKAGDAKWLPEPERSRLVHLEKAAVFAPGVDAAAWPAAPRARYAHVIVDRSAENGFDGDLAAALAKVAEKFPGTPVRRVTLANYETVEQDATSARLDALPLRGGFLADLALAQAIRRHGESDLDASRGDAPPARPVFVILGKKTKSAPTALDLTDAWADLLPAPEIHGMDAEGVTTALRGAGAAETPLLRLGDSVRPLAAGRVARFKPAPTTERLEYWEPAAGGWRPADGVDVVAEGGAWAKAAGLQLRQQDHGRAPGDEAENLKALVAASRESGVLLASTSYIVVENAAQWRMLDAGERKKLDQNAALDFKEAPEPSAALIGAGFLLWLATRRRRRSTERGQTAAANAGRSSPINPAAASQVENTSTQCAGATVRW